MRGSGMPIKASHDHALFASVVDSSSSTKHSKLQEILGKAQNKDVINVDSPDATANVQSLVYGRDRPQTTMSKGDWNSTGRVSAG